MFGFFKTLFVPSVKFKEPKEWDADLHGLLTTLMREFYTIIGDDTGLDVTFEDGPDSFYEGLGDKEPTLDRLQSLTDDDYKNILVCARRILESDQVTEQHIRDVTRVTLSHWIPERQT